MASFDGERFERRDPLADTYYAELKPISEDLWVPESLAVSGLTREHLVANGRRPEDVMPELAAWVRDLARGFNAVFVAAPVGYDWMFAYWYLIRFGETPDSIANSPFSYGRHRNIRDIWATKAGVPVGWSTEGRMPEHLLPSSQHTHNALDDAVAQGELFCNLMEWPGA